MLPFDVLEAVFFHLDVRSLLTARSVCSDWAEVGRQNVVLTAAVANTRLKLTRRMIERGLGLTDAEVCSLPGTAYTTRRGHTCRLYGPEAIVNGLKMSGGRRKLLKRREKQKAFNSHYPKRCNF